MTVKKTPVAKKAPAKKPAAKVATPVKKAVAKKPAAKVAAKKPVAKAPAKKGIIDRVLEAFGKLTAARTGRLHGRVEERVMVELRKEAAARNIAISTMIAAAVTAYVDQ